MTADKLPSVLRHPRGSISIERALKNVWDRLMECAPRTESEEDLIGVALDDVETMLDCIDRS